MKPESLKYETIRGVSWSAIDNLANLGISFLVGLILARLLSPDEFGIIGMTAIFIAVSNSIVDSGLSSALIRKTDSSDIDFNTAFHTNIVLGIFLYIVLFSCATAISRFFNEPILVPVLKIMGIVLIINAFAIIQRTLLMKKVDFKTQTKISLIASIISGVFGIAMALGGLGVWSLVGQHIIKRLLNSFLLWSYNNWRPAMIFSMSSFKELFGFGSKLLLSGIIDTLYKQVFLIIIGKFYSTAQLGQYTRAEEFNTVFSSNLTAVVQRVSYPVLSKIQDESERLKEAYRQLIKITMLVSFGSMMALAAVAQPLIVVLIGEKWLLSASYLQIICFAGMLYPLHAINLNILQVMGRSDLFLQLEIIKKIIAILPISLGIFFGIKLMLWGSVLTSLIAVFLNSHYSSNLINYSTHAQLKDILPSFLISFLVAAVMWSITLLNYSVWITLLLQCIIGLFLAILIYRYLKLREYLELKNIIFSLIKGKKNG